MTDYRTRREKLQAMANQSVSPHEAAIARRKLAELPPEPERVSFSPQPDWYAISRRTYGEMTRRAAAEADEAIINGFGFKVRRRHHDGSRVWYEWEDA